MDLAEAALVFGGGAGLASGLDAGAARAVFDLLTRVAAAAGAAAGAHPGGHRRGLGRA